MDKDFNFIGRKHRVKAARTALKAIIILQPLLTKDDSHDFSPRVGFAWDIGGNETRGAEATVFITAKHSSTFPCHDPADQSTIFECLQYCKW